MPDAGIVRIIRARKMSAVLFSYPFSFSIEENAIYFSRLFSRQIRIERIQYDTRVKSSYLDCLQSDL